MYIAHLAIWVKDIENIKTFYKRYFKAKVTAKYINLQKEFQSYFLTFDSGPRLELMHRSDIRFKEKQSGEESFGYAHIAFSVGSIEAVDTLTERLTIDGYQCLDGPRRTGDGYYESVLLDPEGNRIEITD